MWVVYPDVVPAEECILKMHNRSRYMATTYFRDENGCEHSWAVNYFKTAKELKAWLLARPDMVVNCTRLMEKANREDLWTSPHKPPRDTRE